MLEPNVRAEAMQKYNERERKSNVAECGENVNRPREPVERLKGGERRKGPAFNVEYNYRNHLRGHQEE